MTYMTREIILTEILVQHLVFKHFYSMLDVVLTSSDFIAKWPTVAKETVIPKIPIIARPAPFALRPFAGVYNPFPYGCSILCNHPADFEAKAIVKRAKDAWLSEGKSLLDTEEIAALKLQRETNLQLTLTDNGERDDNVPEELFRKYTDTDSRPITPAPTLVSIATKASQNLRSRRCVTPDPTSFIPTKEKTLLVLDLRRSHSQETIYWQDGQLKNSSFDGGVIQPASTSRTASPPSPKIPKTKTNKAPKKRDEQNLRRTSSVKTDTSKDSDSKGQQTSGTRSPSKSVIKTPQASPEPANNKPSQISRESSSGDIDVIKRRGKKRKGKKTGKDGLKEGEKEVKGIPDPGETQVSALRSDSKEGSSRNSLTGEEKSEETRQEEISSSGLKEPKTDFEQYADKSFLKPEILKQLQRQLDREVVDSELNLKKRIALEEALRLKINPKHSHQGEELKILKKEFQLDMKNSEKWLSIPRVFTRRSARFELPMDSRLLKNMTPLEYVQNYVYASPERLVLYNHVFNLFKEEPEDDEETGRILLGKNVVEALGKIMGRTMTVEEAQDYQDVIGWKDEASLDFRTFTGIAATCERMLAAQFCSKMPSKEEDPRYEVEIADFETLDEKLLRVKPERRLVRILKRIIEEEFPYLCNIYGMNPLKELIP